MTQSPESGSRSGSDPTLKDIARVAGVSVAAVSKVLNNRVGVGTETRERITQVARDIGYKGRGGRAAASGISTAAIVTLDRYVMNDAFYGAIISGILQNGSTAGIDMKVAIAGSVQGDGVIRSLFPSDLPDGLILVGVDAPEVIAEITELGWPSVIVNGMDRTMAMPSVSPDYHFGAWKATRHLLDLGHRNIVHVSHPFRETFRRRIDGFRNAMEEAGIDFDPSHHVIDLGAPEHISTSAGELISKHLDLRRVLPDAFFCVNDIVALGVMQALQARGLSVPGDVSVMGFDGLPIGAHATPALTSMQTDRAALGRIAIELLSERAAHPENTVRRVTVGVELKARQSTGRKSG